MGNNAGYGAALGAGGQGPYGGEGHDLFVTLTSLVFTTNK